MKRELTTETEQDLGAGTNRRPGRGRHDAPYARVCPTYWQDAKREHWSNDATTLGIYLLTCRHKRTEGLFELPLQYVQADLPGRWTLPRIKRTLEELGTFGFALYDDESRVVLLPQAMEYQKPDAPGQMKHAIRILAALPRTRLWGKFLEAAREYAPAFYSYLEQASPDGMADGIGDDMAHPQALSRTPSQTRSSNSVTQDSTTHSSVTQGSSSYGLTPSLASPYSSATAPAEDRDDDTLREGGDDVSAAKRRSP